MFFKKDEQSLRLCFVADAAIQKGVSSEAGLLRCARNDGEVEGRS